MAQPALVAVRSAGPRAVLLEFADGADVRSYRIEADRRRDAGELGPAVELVPGAVTLLIDELDDVAALLRSVREWRPQNSDPITGRLRDVPTYYDGADLADVAQHWGIRPDQVGDAHAALEHEVAFLGFAPGFAYLTGLGQLRAVPRRDRPRPVVPAGSVALAGLYSGVYPRASPGGWQLIGHTDVVLWDARTEPAAYLLPGDRVRFVPVRR